MISPNKTLHSGRLLLNGKAYTFLKDQMVNILFGETVLISWNCLDLSQDLKTKCCTFMETLNTTVKFFSATKEKKTYWCKSSDKQWYQNSCCEKIHIIRSISKNSNTKKKKTSSKNQGRNWKGLFETVKYSTSIKNWKSFWKNRGVLIENRTK